MSDAPTIDRFEELEAGRVLGDLNPEEWREWQELSESVGKNHDASLELVAAAIEADIASRVEEALPAEVEDLIRQDIATFIVDPEPSTVISRPDFTPRASRQTVIAWSIAAALAFLLVAVTLVRKATWS